MLSVTLSSPYSGALVGFQGRTGRRRMRRAARSSHDVHDRRVRRGAGRARRRRGLHHHGPAGRAEPDHPRRLADAARPDRAARERRGGAGRRAHRRRPRVLLDGHPRPAVRASYTKEQIVELVRLANRTFDAIEALPQVVIAALNGIARAGAAELSLACDIRLAAAHATLAWPEALWGGFPGAGAPVRLPAIVGRARALELLCTGRELRADEMERLGLVLGVYPAARLLDEATALAMRIAASGPLAIRGAKRIMHMRALSGFAAARTLSDTLRHALEWSRDVDEGMAAHREGRP